MIWVKLKDLIDFLLRKIFLIGKILWDDKIDDEYLR
jgi:hypothetical protein